MNIKIFILSFLFFPLFSLSSSAYAAEDIAGPYEEYQQSVNQQQQLEIQKLKIEEMKRQQQQTGNQDIENKVGTFCEGFEQGYVTSYKQAKRTGLAPLAPLCPLQPLKGFGDPESDFEHGYTIGYKRGMGDGSK